MIDTDKSMRWMFSNLLETGIISFDVSSENAFYPKENMLDGSQRTKVFKFGGRFLIDATNNKLYLNAGTYTIPSADYNDLNSLINAINTVTAGVASFSYFAATNIVAVTYVGGVTLVLSNQVNAAWQTIGFTGVANIVLGAGISQSADEARVHWPYEEITVDFGYQASIGFVGMIHDLAQEMKIPEGAEVKIFGNTVNSFVAPPLEQVIPWYSTGCFKFIDDIDDSAWRYVKIRITCPSGPFIPEIGYLYLGEYEKFTDKNIGTGFELTHDDYSQLSQADSGAQYYNARTSPRVLTNLSVGLARPTHAALLKRIYALKGRGVPFFVALDPQSYLSDTFDEHLAYVRFTEAPRYRHILRNIFELSFNLREAL